MTIGSGIAVVGIWGAVAVTAVSNPMAAPLVAIMAVMGTMFVSASR